MTNNVNTLLLETVAELIDQYPNTEFAGMLEKQLENDDLETLLYLVNNKERFLNETN
jgi:hypothetical protein